MKEILLEKGFQKTRAEKRSAKATEYYKRTSKMYCAIKIQEPES
jgi:hypothetical protein